VEDKMKIIIRPFRPGDIDAVIRLWRECRLVVPENDPAKDIRRKKKEHPELFLVVLADGELVGSVMGGYDGHRGAVNYLAVAPSYQWQGIGRMLMRVLEAKLRKLGCAKINLFVRKSNDAVGAFYRKIGFDRNEVGIPFGKRLSSDNPKRKIPQDILGE
jgi:ribosomal protein S18 acetylase RimI-like enzyme